MRHSRPYRWRPDIKSLVFHREQQAREESRAFFVYDGLGLFRGKFPKAEAERLVSVHDQWTLSPAS